ncbi:UNVERIFIED_ORG: site-specific integrase [Clostridium botulinum]
MDLEYNITYRQKDKGIQAIISYKDNSGKWRQKSKQGFKTKKDAKLVVSKLVKEIELMLSSEQTIININYDSITFKQLSDSFIEHSKLYRESNTVRTYRNAQKNFELIYDKKVIELKKIDINRCVDTMLRKNIKNKTILGYVKKIKLMFDYYKDNYDTNFYMDLKIKLTCDKEEKEKTALTKSELKKLFSSEKLKKSRYYIVAFIAANCGLRCGEILGLTWDDINKNDMTLSINKQWKKLQDDSFGFGTLKSKNSYRKVPISKKIIKVLDEYKEAHPISINKRIAPFSYDCINNYLNPILTNLVNITIHELRHTYITLLIANGLDFKTVAKIAGHDVKQTLKTYSHVTDDMFKNAQDKISKIF